MKAFLHLQELHCFLHEHLTSSRHALDTSGIVIQTGSQVPVDSSNLYPKLAGEGMSGSACKLEAQIPT